MGGLFGGHASTPPAPQPAPPPPTVVDPAVQQAAQEAQQERAQAAGRASTILTSGMGDTSAAPVQRKTLLGGP